MSECEGAADALMMLTIHTVDVRPAAEALPLGNAATRNSFIVVKRALCNGGCAFLGSRLNK